MLRQQAGEPVTRSTIALFFQSHCPQTVILTLLHSHALQVLETDARVAEIHASTETFDSKAELSFKYLQVSHTCT